MSKTPKRILVIDDNADIHQCLKLYLEREGYAVDTAENGYAGIGYLGAGNDPALVICDVNMLGMSGQDVLTCITLRWPALPVVMFTADTCPALQADLERLGACAVVHKGGASLAALRTALYHALKGKEAVAA